MNNLLRVAMGGVVFLGVARYAVPFAVRKAKPVILAFVVRRALSQFEKGLGLNNGHNQIGVTQEEAEIPQEFTIHPGVHRAVEGIQGVLEDPKSAAYNLLKKPEVQSALNAAKRFLIRVNNNRGGA